jgi:hypothetical protein
MPRQPYTRVVPNPQGAVIDFGTGSLGKRPEVELLAARCLLLWPSIEAEMALILGHLIGAKDTPALVVFQQLRQSRTQRDTISEAAQIVLNERDQELLSAALNIHKSTEAERNALAHGHIGTSTMLPDALLWMHSNDYIAIRTVAALAGDPSWDDTRNKKFLSKIWVYRKQDLKKILEDIEELAWVWFFLLKYLQTPQSDPSHDRQYLQLCDRQRIGQELERLRREKIPSSPCGSPKPDQPPKQ